MRLVKRRTRIAVTAGSLGVACLTGSLLATSMASSAGRITPTPDRSNIANRAAVTFARAIADNPKWVRKASFSALPPFSNPAAVSTKRMKGFPLRGKSYALLSTGNATKIDNPDNSGSSSTETGGPSIRGARDVIIHRTVLRVPKKANCLSIRFRFLSEEFPEFANDAFNDAFIAELDDSTWTAATKQDPTIKAPLNFAFDKAGNPVRVNTVGEDAVKGGEGNGTTYDGGTVNLRASTRVTPGRHVLYLSIFDQGDRQYDSTVMLDHLSLGKRKNCKSGAVPD